MWRGGLADEARRAIFGYTIVNDWSARDLQSREMQVGLGPAKGKDFATSIGPWIVTADELAPHHDADGFLDLDCRASVNGELIGHDRLSHMHWTFPQMIAYASRDSVVLRRRPAGLRYDRWWRLPGRAVGPPRRADPAAARGRRPGEHDHRGLGTLTDIGRRTSRASTRGYGRRGDERVQLGLVVAPGLHGDPSTGPHHRPRPRRGRRPSAMVAAPASAASVEDRRSPLVVREHPARRRAGRPAARSGSTTR